MTRDASSALRAMTHSIAHRGPDDEGAWCDAAQGMALGHRRLSIVDLSPEGHQPMPSADGRYQLAFNGEIYNHRALRQELLASGERFRGHSDTEVMLSAIVRWGLEQAVERFAGMFSFALWDRTENTLALVRDRFGEKPLYFAQLGRTLLFGSELKALQRHPAWQGEVDRDALALYFRHNYIPAPYTAFRNVRKVLPGTIVRFRRTPDAAPETAVYWSSRAAAEAGMRDPLTGADAEILDGLDGVLRRSIGEQMVADVPLGAFLSGGVDSSLVVALMQAQSDRPVRTFTIGFHEKAFDEADHARAVARHLGTHHTEAYISPAEAREVIPRLPTLYDEPFADSSQIPTFLVAELARRQVTVSLSGDGGDELFGGYGRYADLQHWWRHLQRIPGPLRQVAARSLCGTGGRMHERVLSGVRPLIGARAGRMLEAEMLTRIAKAMRATTPEELYRGLVSHWARPAALVLGAQEPPSALSAPGDWAKLGDVVERAMYLDTVSYLPDDILVKVDRATMGVGLESRAPLLDHRVAEFAWSIPQHAKIRNGTQKWVLRELLFRYVPRALIERPKMGFGVPVGEWLRGPIRSWAEALLAPDRLRRERLLDPLLVQKTWQQHLAGRDHQAKLWGILMLQAWLDAQGGAVTLSEPSPRPVAAGQ